MRWRIWLAGVATVVVGQVQVGRAQAPARVTDIGWLVGCWEQRTGAAVIEELWTPARAGTMLAVGRTTREGRLVEYEFVVVREDASGLTYEAHPSGQPTATFRASQASSDSVVFENPAHDFPQRVGYRRSSADVLEAWISGARGGQERRIDFRYQRRTCTEP